MKYFLWFNKNCNFNFRVRDEFKNQLEAYKTLYESSIAYGMRKMIDSEKKKTDLNTENNQLERECSDL